MKRPRIVRMRSTFGHTFSVRERGQFWTDARGARRAWSTRAAATAAVDAELEARRSGDREESAAKPDNRESKPKPEIAAENGQTGDLRGGRRPKGPVRPSPRTRKSQVPASEDSLKARVQAWLKERPDATNGEVVAAFDELRTSMDVIRLIHG